MFLFAFHDPGKSFFINVKSERKIQFSVPSTAEFDMTSSGSGYERHLANALKQKLCQPWHHLILEALACASLGQANRGFRVDCRYINGGIT